MKSYKMEAKRAVLERTARDLGTAINTVYRLQVRAAARVAWTNGKMIGFEPGTKSTKRAQRALPAAYAAENEARKEYQRVRGW